MIPYGRQSISEEDIAAVVSVLRGEWLTQGPTVNAFEQAVSNYCGVSHAVAVNSATSALHLACLALDVGPGDIVWTVPNTFVASANCARYCGAEVDFVDIDQQTLCMSIEALSKKLEDCRSHGRPLPSVVIPVHFGGQSCDMAAIAVLATLYGFQVIEDASHAIGATYQGKPVGDCRFSDICIFSFHPVKVITSGEGGMAVTNDPALAKRMMRLRSHGITRDRDEMENTEAGAWYYEQIELGMNYRMTDIQAALGLSQLNRLDQFVLRRNQLAARYDAAFEGLNIQTQHIISDAYSARHLYVIRVPAAQHEFLFSELRSADIGVNLHYFPVHLQPYYQRLGFGTGYCPSAEQYAKEAISLPLYPGMTDAQQAIVIDTVKILLNSFIAEPA